MCELIEIPLIDIVGLKELKSLLSMHDMSYSKLFFSKGSDYPYLFSNLYCGIGIVEYEGGDFFIFTGMALKEGLPELFEDVSIKIESLFSICAEKFAI